jgi:Tol biopolymer transport system component
MIRLRFVRFWIGVIACLTPGAGFMTIGFAQTTQRASVDSSGFEGAGNSGSASISADGRYVAFVSDAANLVAGDNNGTLDVFVRDRTSGTTIRVSLDSTGAEANGNSDRPALSADGRFLAFRSDATNLVAGDTNGSFDIFVRDLSTGATVRASVDSGGAQAAGASDFPSLSSDGRFVAFMSSAPLVPGDTNSVSDVFVRDLVLGQTTRVSVSSSAVQANGASRCAPGSISADGRFVAFESAASNLVAGDTNAKSDVFVRDLVAGTTVRVSVDSAGAQSNQDSIMPSISADGMHVSFESAASNLVAGDTNGVFDVFVRDLSTGVTVRASVDSSGAQGDFASGFPSWTSISGDGRVVAFASFATNLVAADTNGAFDVFARDLAAGQTVRASVDAAGAQSSSDSGAPSVSSDARYVAFESSSADLVPEDTNSASDVFVRDLVSVPIVTFCFGDGFDSSVTTLCPCFNFGGMGRGCSSSQNAGGAFLNASGTSAPDTLVLRASGELPSALTIFLQGDAVNASGVVFGDGLRCADGNLLHLYVKHASSGLAIAPAAGDRSISAQSAALGDPIALGSVRYYQAYYRDPNLSFCSGMGFNATSAAAIHW